MSTNKIKLSEAEWKVMKLLWEESPKTMMQITNLLKETTGWTKHTVMTFLKRMEEKEAIHYEEGGRAKLYYPDIKKEEVVLQETEEFLHKVFDGRMGLMLNTMVRCINKLVCIDFVNFVDSASGKGKDQSAFAIYAVVADSAAAYASVSSLGQFCQCNEPVS